MIKVSLIGSGNVAHHLIEAFSKAANVELVQVMARHPENISHLLSPNQIISDYSQLLEADLYIIAVSDAAVSEVSQQLPFKNKLVAHTSGSLAMDALADNNRKAVFYPLQTFSKTKSVDFKMIPIGLESANATDFKVV